MKIILDSMDLAEVGQIVLERSVDKMTDAMCAMLRKQKDYERAMRRRGEVKTYFKPIVYKDVDITFNFVPYCNGKKDLAKYGLLFLIIGQFRHSGDNYYFMSMLDCYKNGKIPQVAIYTTHMLQRYVERHLKDDSPVNFDTFFKFVRETDGLSIGFEDENYKVENSCQWATSIGVTCGEVLHPCVLLHKTFINEDTIMKGKKKTTIDNGYLLSNFMQYDKYGRRFLPRSIAKHFNYAV